MINNIKNRNISLITKAAVYLFIFLVLNYFGLVYIAYHNIQTFSKIVYNKEIENSIKNHLDEIKANHKLRQSLLVERINNDHSIPWNKVSPKIISMILKKHATDLFDTKKIEIVKNKINIKLKIKSSRAYWINQEILKLSHFNVIFKKNISYLNFLHVQNLHQNYQIFGTKAVKKIEKSFWITYSIAFLIGFMGFLILFYFLGRKLKIYFNKILFGLYFWGTKDRKFRFDQSLPGELLLMTNQFNAMAEKIEQDRLRNFQLEKISSWQDIAKKLAHEIKNPLTPIQMMVNQIKRQYKPQFENKDEQENFSKLIEQSHDIIIEEVSILRRLVDNFSYFAKLPSPVLKNVLLVPLINSFLELQKAAYPEHKFEFDFEPKDQSNVFLVLIDDGLILQVLNNLVKNAVEASMQLNQKAQIKIELLKILPSFITLRVIDDGPGIPKEIQAKLFEAYVSTKHTGPIQGMGLGLTICHKIILELGGRIKFQSIPKHTVFEIELPANHETI